MADTPNQPEQPSTRPAFSAPLYAALRQGAKELGQVLPAFPDSVRPVEEPGTLGNPTQAMVTEQIGTVHGSYQEMLNDASSRSTPAQDKDRGRER